MNCSSLILKYNDILSCNFTTNYTRNATISISLFTNSYTKLITCK